MNGKNVRGDGRGYWRILPVVPAAMLADIARQAEDQGISGLFAAQVFGPPFIPLAAAAAVTSRVKLATGIAVSSTRSPFETAMAARDLDMLSAGRFILGLGSSTPSFVKNVYGERGIKPLSHVRETLAAVRYIHENAHLGLNTFDGEYYQADFSELETLPPPFSPRLPVWIGALREKMTRLAIKEGDGLIGHPMWSVDWALNNVKPMLEEELQRSARERTELEINLWLWAAPGKDEKQAIEDARATVAFYGGMKDYESYFAALGFLDAVRKLQAGEDPASAVPDEMVRAFVGVGEPDKILQRFEPLWQLADSICVVPPFYRLAPERQAEYATRIAATFRPET